MCCLMSNSVSPIACAPGTFFICRASLRLTRRGTCSAVTSRRRRFTYRNTERVLQAAGSGLDQILQMTSFVLDLERNGARYVAARQKILTSHTYTSAVIGVSALMMRGLLLEVQCCAAATAPGAAAAAGARSG